MSATLFTELPATIRLALPLVVAQLLMVSMGFIDTLMVGRLGAVALGAVALGSALWMMMLLALVGIHMGLSAVFSQCIGSGQLKELPLEYQQGLWLALFTGIVGFFLTRWLGLLMPLLGLDPSVIPDAQAYLNAISWGVPAFALFLPARYINEAQGDSRPLMLQQALILPIGILGNYVLIFGHWGFPQMGVAGAGLASAITFWLGALLMHLYNCRHFQALSLYKPFQGPDFKHLLKFLSLGLPIMFSILMESGLFSSVALLMGRIGAEALAAHQVVINYASLMFMIPLGISMALTVRMGHAVGAGDRHQQRIRAYGGILLSLALMCTSATVMLLFPRQIIGLYTDDAAVINIAMTLLFAAALFQIWDGLQVSAAGILRGLKDVRVPMLVTAFSYWGVGFSLAWYLGLANQHWPAGLWYGLVAGLIIAALFLTARIVWMLRPACDPQP